MQHDSNRRQWLKKSLLLGVAAPFAGLITKMISQSASAQAPAAPATGAKPAAPAAGTKPGAPAAGAKPNIPMLAVTDPQAQALGYVEDASKVDTKKWPKRAGPQGAKQFCYNCQFYQPAAGTDPKATAAAPCTIFAGKGVTAKGWCNTWTQNPKVTT